MISRVLTPAWGLDVTAEPRDAGGGVRCRVKSGGGLLKVQSEILM
jgi:hypothetical protein